MKQDKYFNICVECMKITTDYERRKKDCYEKKQFLFCIHEYRKMKLQMQNKIYEKLNSNISS